MHPDHIPYRNLLWIAPLLAAEFWLLANPPAWAAALRDGLGSLLLLLLIPLLFLLWVGFWKAVVAVLFGGR